MTTTTTALLAEALRSAHAALKVPDTCDACYLQPCSSCATIGVARDRAAGVLARYDREAAAVEAEEGAAGAWHVSDYTASLQSGREDGVCIMLGDDTVLDLPFTAAWPEAVQRARAERIVACVNACEGMSTERISEFTVGRLAECAENWVQAHG